METITTYTGNGDKNPRNLPNLVFLSHDINDTALAHITKQTGLEFTPCTGGYEAQPVSGKQIVALFMTYNFKTKYCDNIDSKNTLYLKHDHHVGFQVDSLCLNCCKENKIPTLGMSSDSRLSC